MDLVEDPVTDGSSVMIGILEVISLPIGGTQVRQGCRLKRGLSEEAYFEVEIEAQEMKIYSMTVHSQRTTIQLTKT